MPAHQVFTVHVFTLLAPLPLSLNPIGTPAAHCVKILKYQKRNQLITSLFNYSISIIRGDHCVHRCWLYSTAIVLLIIVVMKIILIITITIVILISFIIILLIITITVVILIFIIIAVIIPLLFIYIIIFFIFVVTISTIIIIFKMATLIINPEG